MNLALQQKTVVKVNDALSTAKFEEYRQEIQIIVDRCKKFKIKDEKGLGEAVDVLSQVRAVNKKLDMARKEVIEEAKVFQTAVNRKIQEWTAPLSDADTNLQGKIKDFRRIEEQKRREMEEKARKEAEKLQAKLNKEAEKKNIKAVDIPAPRLPKMPNVSTGAMGKVAGRKTWKAELTDLRALVTAIASDGAPEELLAFNQSFANQLARNCKGSRKIPGIKFYEEESLSVYG